MAHTGPLQETQGDTFEKNINFSDDEGNTIDITGWTIYVTVKRDIEDSDADAVLSREVTSHDNATNGETSFSFSASETDELDTIYHLEIRFKNNDGDVKTILRRRLEFTKAVRQTT